MKNIDIIAMFALLVILMGACGIVWIGARALHDSCAPAEVVRR